MSRRKSISLAAVILGLVFLGAAPAWSEQSMSDYTAYPVFLTASVTPNIMIILDNSGSMNFNAYGTYVGDYQAVPDAPYTGPGFGCGQRTYSVVQSSDDAEEWLDTNQVMLGYSDAYLGVYSTHNTMIGVRFQNVDIPKNTVIKSAYIQFRAYSSQASVSSLSITGVAEDNTATFTTTASDISSRPSTASVAWNGIPAWTAGFYYTTPDLTDIVQAIVNRGGWQSGNAMAFQFQGSGTRVANAYDSGFAAPTLVVEIEEDCPNTIYYGYFSPYQMYSYVSNQFNIDPAGSWSGNWLNWLCMRRIDILRKVLMGGLATARTGGGNQVNYGETPNQSNRVFDKWFNGTGVSPYSGNYRYRMEGGYIKVYNSSGTLQANYNIRIQKDVNIEPEDFLDGNLAGVLQKVGDRARWGNMWFYDGSGTNQEGGRVANIIGTNMTTLITDLQNTGADTWTPLAEAYYVATQYFKQEAPQAGLGYANGAAGPFNSTRDPYYDQGNVVECAKSFVILLTDGASTKDSKIPAALKDYDTDGEDNTLCNESTTSNCDYPDGGTDYLDDVALYARVNDLRPVDLDGVQNLLLYAIYAFGSDENARKLLKDAARNGGFEDINGNNRPDLQQEWDINGDGVPDTYFEATDGYALERQLLAAITAILKRASSGTAVSVLATSAEGEGTLAQAYFKPAVSTGVEDVRWVGYLHTLWVDSLGRLREDTDGAPGLEPGLNSQTDKIVEFFFDEGSGEARFYRFDLDANGNKAFSDANGNGVQDAGEDFIYTDHVIDDLKPIWEAGGKLATRLSATRVIKTFTDVNNNGIVDAGEYIFFDTGNAGILGDYLGISAQTFLGPASTNLERATNLIKYIRGDAAGYVGNANLRAHNIGGNIWKLGDIVHSTPVTIGKPLDNYGLIYGDITYQTYYDAYKNRESVIYIGGNDGMLHAILLGSFRSGDNPNTATVVEEAYLTRDATTTEDFGDELWSFIPQALLPHLKWLADPDYTHVYYVDLKPRIVDAKIFTPGVDANGINHPDGWGTVLLGGLNLGGKTIDVNDMTGAYWRTFYPSYFAMDVTDPHNPILLWERSYNPSLAANYSMTDLGLTTGTPTVAKVGTQWYGILGSGPTNYDGTSTHQARVYVVNLLTGEVLRNYQAAESGAFMGSPITVDVGLNYNVDVGYIGETYAVGSNWKGKMYRFLVPILDDTSPNPNLWVYDPDPANWQFSVMFESEGPITAAPAASIDERNNFWVFFGTGRYYSDADRADLTTQYMYGVKDPFYNSSMYYVGAAVAGKDAALGHVIAQGDLLDVSGVDIYTDGSVSGLGGVTTWTQLLTTMNSLDGWRLDLINGERILTDPRVLGGIVLDPTFIPNPDPCGFGGNSNLLGLYFTTGTAYTEEVFVGGSEVVGGKTKVLRKTSLGVGMGSSIGLHIGMEEGAQGYVQQSTGVVQDVQINPALKIKSGLIWWRER